MITRRTAMIAALGAAVWATAAFAEAPKPYQVTQDLINAAKKEGTVVFYTATDVKVAEKLGQVFEQKYPGIKVQVERSGSERVFQRIGQEYSAGIYNADVVETSDAVHFLYFKKHGWLQPAVPEAVAKYWPEKYRDPDGLYAAYRAHLCIMGYNSKMVDAKDAPKSYKDLLDPKWKNKIVKANPGYSGTIVTATYDIVQILGWDYFKKLAEQNILQVQSSTEPPKKVAEGERPIMADGNEYNVFRLKESGVPIEPIYPEEGTPLVVGNAAILSKPPHPNAAKLFYAFLFSREAQQLNSDFGGLRSFRPDVKEKAGRKPLSEIKLLYEDPADTAAHVEELKKKYAQIFGS